MSARRVEKMRRHAERNAAARAAVEHEKWLDGLAPDHREVHQRSLVCPRCLADAIERHMDPITRAMHAWAERVQ